MSSHEEESENSPSYSPSYSGVISELGGEDPGTKNFEPDDIDSDRSWRYDSDSFESLTDNSDEDGSEIECSSQAEQNQLREEISPRPFTGFSRESPAAVAQPLAVAKAQTLVAAAAKPLAAATAHSSSAAATQPSASASTESKCTCHALSEIYQDWCRRTLGRGSSPEDYFSTLLEHLAVIKSSFDTLSITHGASSNGSSVDPSQEDGGSAVVQRRAGAVAFCPVHGRPELPEKPSCEESPAKEQVASLETPQSEDTVAAKMVTDEEKKEKKAISRANKKLVKVKTKIEAAMKKMEMEGKKVDATFTWLENNKEKAEKAMMDHVTWLHSLIDHHHQRAMEDFSREQQHFLQQILQEKLEVQNYTSRLAQMQAELQEKFEEVKQHGVAATANVPTLCDKFNGRISSIPQQKVLSRPTINVEVPEVLDEDIASLVGHFRITEKSPPESKQAATTDPSKEKKKEKKKQAAASSLAKKDKTSAMMASAPSLATKGSVTRSAGTGSKEEKKADAKGNAAQTVAASSKKKKEAETFAMGGKDKSSDPMASASSSISKAQAKGATPASGQEMTGVTGYPAAVVPMMKVDAVSPWVTSDKTYAQMAAANTSISPALKKDSVAASLAKQQKNSSLTASTVSLPAYLNSSSGSKKRRGRRGGKKKKKGGENSKASAEPKKSPPCSIDVYRGAYPVVFQGRGKQVTSLAPRLDGKVWVVYGYYDPHLDLLGGAGQVEKSTKVGGNTLFASYFDPEHVLVASHSPQSQLRLYDADGKQIRTIGLEITSTSLSIGFTGIVVSSNTALYWIALDGGENKYIVPKGDSRLKKISSTAVVFYQGNELVCVADKELQAVLFFRKEESGDFTPLAPLTAAHIVSYQKENTGSPKSSDGSFVPVSVTAHPKGFLAILDAASESVVILNMELQRAARFIPVNQVCAGEPCVIAFGPDRSEDRPTMWAASTSGCVCLTNLVFEYPA